MPIKKDKKKVVKQKQKQSQKQIVNIYNTTKRVVSKGKPAVAKTTASSFYQTIPQASQSFSLADMAKLLNKPPVYVPQMVSNPIPASSQPVAQPVNVSPASQLYEGSFVPLPARKSVSLKLPPQEKPQLYEGSFVPLPARKPVSLKLPPQEKPRIVYGDTVVIRRPKKPIIEQPEDLGIVKKTRRNKQQMDEARAMGQEDISSIHLGLYQFNRPPKVLKDDDEYSSEYSIPSTISGLTSIESSISKK